MAVIQKSSGLEILFNHTYIHIEAFSNKRII